MTKAKAKRKAAPPKPTPARPMRPVAPAPSQAVAIRAPEPKSMLAVIAAAAANRAVDPAKMQALLNMQQQIEVEKARRDFIDAFIALSAELPVIRADGKIEIREKEAGGQRTGRVQQATPYATFQAIMRAIKPVLHRHGFALSFSTEPTPDGTRIIVKGLLEHTNGHHRTTAFPLPAETSGSKNNVQGWGSSLSYGKRYATIALLNIISSAPQDADLDGAKIVKGDPAAIDGEVLGPPAITTEQHDKLVDTIEACGVGRPTFCKHYGIEKVADLPAARFDEAMKACSDFKANQEAKRKHG